MVHRHGTDMACPIHIAHLVVWYFFLSCFNKERTQSYAKSTKIRKNSKVEKYKGKRRKASTEGGYIYRLNSKQKKTQTREKKKVTRVPLHPFQPRMQVAGGELG